MKKFLCLILICTVLLSGCDSKKITIKVVNSNGELLDSFEIEKGDNISNRENPKLDGYIFVSWLKDGLEYDTSSPIYEDITLEATFTKVPKILKNYTVSFDFGEEVKTQTVKEGDKVNMPKEPVRDNYKFLGWYKDNELYDFARVVDSDITLQARWEEVMVLITYELNGGSGITNVQIEKGNKLSKPDEPTRYGYHFLGWYKDNELYDFDTIVDKSITLQARWEAIKYVIVSFDTGDGSLVNSRIIEAGDKLTDIENPKLEGYTFLYWTLDGEIFDTDSEILDDITLVAVYEKSE